jgi:hypothetical protein
LTLVMNVDAEARAIRVRDYWSASPVDVSVP